MRRLLQLTPFATVLALAPVALGWNTPKPEPKPEPPPIPAPVEPPPAPVPAPVPPPVTPAPTPPPVVVPPAAPAPTCADLYRVGAGVRWLKKFGCPIIPKTYTCAELLRAGAGPLRYTRRGFYYKCQAPVPVPTPRTPVTG